MKYLEFKCRFLKFSQGINGVLFCVSDGICVEWYDLNYEPMSWRKITWQKNVILSLSFESIFYAWKSSWFKIGFLPIHVSVN